MDTRHCGKSRGLEPVFVPAPSAEGGAAGVLSRGLPVFLLSHWRKDIILRKETLASAKKEASVKCIWQARTADPGVLRRLCPVPASESQKAKRRQGHSELASCSHGSHLLPGAPARRTASHSQLRRTISVRKQIWAGYSDASPNQPCSDSFLRMSADNNLFIMNLMTCIPFNGGCQDLSSRGSGLCAEVQMSPSEGSRLTTVSTPEPRLRTAGDPSVLLPKRACCCAHPTGSISAQQTPPPTGGDPATGTAAVRIFTCQSCDNSGQFKGKERVLRSWLFPEVERGKNIGHTHRHHQATPSPLSFLCVPRLPGVSPLLSLCAGPKAQKRTGWVGVRHSPPLSLQLFPGLEVAWYHLVPELFLPQMWRNYKDLEGHGQQLTSVFRTLHFSEQSGGGRGKLRESKRLTQAGSGLSPSVRTLGRQGCRSLRPHS